MTGEAVHPFNNAFLDAELSADVWCERVVVVNQRGFHARAAAKFVRVAEGFDAEITVTRDDLSVAGRSILGLMMLAATTGTPLKICAKGPKAAEAIAALTDLVKRKFDEE